MITATPPVYIFKPSRIRIVVNQNRIGKDERGEHVVPMHMKLVNDLVEFLHLALLGDKVAEIQDVDVEKKPLFSLAFLSVVFHMLPSVRIQPSPSRVLGPR